MYRRVREDMLRLGVMFCLMGVTVWGDQNAKQIISEHRMSGAFQQVYQIDHQQALEKKNVFMRLWSKVKGAVMPQSSTREYDLFVWWWVEQCIANPSLDPTGLITRELLTQALGFGGWSNASNNPDGVEADQLKQYQSAAFLFYWHHPDMAKPAKGPAALQKAWRASQDKQCLWVEPHFVEPSNIDEWLRNMTPEGWSPEHTPLDEAIAQKFDCPHAFNKTMRQKWLSFYGEVEEMLTWLGAKPYHAFFAFFKAMQTALKNDDMSLEQQREWLKNVMMLAKIMSANDIMNFLKCNDASYLGCLNMLLGSGEAIEVEDVPNFREFLRAFDPQTVDIEKNWKYLKWLNGVLFIGFHHKWQATCGDKEKKLDEDGATNPIVLFKLLYDEEAARGLWPAVKSDNFPYVSLFLSLTTHGDIDTQSPVYKAALIRALRRGYDLNVEPGLRNFLWEYMNNINDAPEAVRTRYVAVEACTIDERDIAVGEVLEIDEVESLSPLYQGMFHRQEVCVHPYNIWQDPSPDVVQQRISMAIDFLLAKDVWPCEYAQGLLEKKHKLAIMLLIYQRMMTAAPKDLA